MNFVSSRDATVNTSHSELILQKVLRALRLRHYVDPTDSKGGGRVFDLEQSIGRHILTQNNSLRQSWCKSLRAYTRGKDNSTVPNVE